MIFKKMTLFTALLFCGFAFTSAYAANQERIALTNDRIPGAGQAKSFVIECMSENITIKQEGSEFKVEVDSDSERSYRIRDNTALPMEERNYRYNKWDIIFERIDRLDTSAAYSTAVNVTIPENISELYVRTWNGNIEAGTLSNIRLTVESMDGEIMVNDEIYDGSNTIIID